MNNLKDLQIVDAAAEDAEGIINVQEKTWLATYPNEEFGITVEDIKAKDFMNPERVERWRKSVVIRTAEKHTWVAKISENIVGFCIVKQTEKQGEIGAIYLLPEYQGKGIGKQLMEKALQWFGKKDIVVNVASYNKPSIAFYERFGFKEVGPIDSAEIAKLPSGKVIPEIRMLRKA